MRLSRHLDELKPVYDAVVVGSGYGAGIAASRLARMGLKVAVLERGLEIPIGEFPDTTPQAVEQFQYTIDGKHIGRRTGLFDMHVGRDMHVLVGCGLGGTSLINANVSLPPNARVWEDARWPAELFDDDSLNVGFDRAKAMLRPLPYPDDPKRKPLAKMERMAEAAQRLGSPLTRPPINVVFDAGTNAAGVHQPACTGCGDCCSGCNVGAKSTVQMTYLPDAVDHGAEIFTDVSVRHVRKEADGWRVFYTVTSQKRDGFKSPERTIAAPMVVLGAGSLGSTEILLRSKAQGLAVSDKVGQGFTGNGDVLAFAWNGQKPVNAVGIGEPPTADVDPPGPCIASAIDLRHEGPLQDGMIIEEGVLPSGLAEVAPGLFAIAGKVGRETNDGLLDDFHQAVRRAESWLLGAYKGAMHNTSTFLVMAHDDGAGRLYLEDDRIAVDWPGVASQPVFQRISAKLLEVSAANSGTYIRNPIQATPFGKSLITVHPLGGCAMAASRTAGVVDHKCRVFDGTPGAADAAVHDGLYVVDGAVLPRSVGVNPLLTISAIAERAMIKIAADLGRQLTTTTRPDKPVRHLVTSGRSVGLAQGLVRSIKRGVPMRDLSGGRMIDAMTAAAGTSLERIKATVGTTTELVKRAGEMVGTANPDLPSGDPHGEASDGTRPAGVTFTERMAGFISDRSGADHDAAATVGRTFGKDFAFTVSIRVDDIDAFMLDAKHEGRLTGTAICKDLSPEPLDISDGIFRLMRRAEAQVETRLFEYIMTLTARDGRRFAFTGRKYVHDDHRFGDLWKDTTTLYVDIVENGGSGAVRRGVLTIAPDDFAKQLRTLAGIGGRSPLDRLNATAKFGALFAGTLYDIYGDVFAPAKRYNPNRVRKKRGLRAGTPRVHAFTTADGKHLRLTRYNTAGAESKGPLLFTHGLGVSSQIFSVDTIDTNLLEYMVERGYDCWLLDFRASIDLPYARERWTGDDCAKFDYQPAVDLIRRETGAASVQVMAHCFGATTFTMAVLGGYLTGVRSALISQISTDVLVRFFPQRLLAFLRAPSLLAALGIDHVNARATTEDGFANKLIDGFIRLAVPFQREERNRNATSSRITALYGQLYETDQLNALTFESGLAEMFGEANIEAFQHLALLTRKRILLDASGEDKYMPHLDRMAFPVCFVHGAENACFMPESTARTVDKLSARNGGKLYTRHVIPNYGHIDCIFGKNAASDVFPKIHEHLEKTARP
ncbi:MAG: GMC family oxidoreductase N-terminal domain-containing protein [Hyphomicrobiaceae bacterium]